jgi:hypothetical protein
VVAAVGATRIDPSPIASIQSTIKWMILGRLNRAEVGIANESSSHSIPLRVFSAVPGGTRNSVVLNKWKLRRAGNQDFDEILNGV